MLLLYKKFGCQKRKQILSDKLHRQYPKFKCKQLAPNSRHN